MPQVSDEALFEKIDHVSDFRLPASYTREIGRVIVRWAYVEHHVQSVIWALAFNCDELGGSLGRLAIVEQKFPQRLDLLKHLAKLRGVAFDKSLLKSLETKSKKLVAERNLLAHGCWTKHPVHGWIVRETRGEWEPSKTGPKGTRKLMPEAKQRDQNKIGKTVADLDSLIADFRAFKQSLQYLP